MDVSNAGLTRDKQIEAEAMETAMMTGCGSVLWMAPEILVAGRLAFRLSNAVVSRV